MVYVIDPRYLDPATVKTLMQRDDYHKKYMMNAASSSSSSSSSLTIHPQVTKRTRRSRKSMKPCKSRYWPITTIVWSSGGPKERQRR